MNEGWIVVVDDNPIELRLVQVLLVAAGYDVRTARDTKAAAQLLALFAPRLMLVDFHARASRHIDYVRRLRAAPATRDIVIIAMTPRGGTQQLAREAGCSECVAKPIDTMALLEAVARRLGRHNALS